MKKNENAPDKWGLMKLCRIMKITGFLILVFTLQSFANSYAQSTKLNLSMNNATFKEFIEYVEENTEFYFMLKYDEEILDKKVDLEYKNVQISEILDDILENSGYSYKIIDRYIAISKNGNSSFSIQQNNVSGKITDENGQPLPGVTIVIKGTTNGTVTDMDGNYLISNIPNNAILVFSFVGMRSQEIEVGTKATINVTMERDAIGIEEVVAIGYGTMKKSDLTGSVASVSSEELTAYPTVNAVQALQGRTAGLQVQPQSGEPGSSVIVRIRGASSINAGSDPIFVVDGFVGASLPPAEDIESVEILKDASATAIYGSRGANGVVIVTTKRGKAGEMKINFNASYSVQEVIKKLDVLNREEYIPYVHEITPDYVFPEGNTDWQNVVFQTGKIQNYQLSVSGGQEKVKYYLSGVYYDQEGIVLSSKFNRISLQNNIEVEPIEGVRFGSNIYLMQSKNEGGDLQGAVGSAYTYMPAIGIYNEDGTFARQAVNNDNPYVHATENEDKSLAHRMQANLYGEVDIFSGLTFRTSLGVSANNSRRGQYNPTTTVVGEGTGGSATMSTSKATMLLNENYLTYTNEFADIHRLNVVGGYSYQKTHNESLSASGDSFISDALSFWNLREAVIWGAPGSGLVETELASVYGRLNYSLMDRYLFTFTSRYDGSSSFSKNNKWAYFPSGAFAWNVKNESFLEDINWLSQLKLRASYGKTGNQAINAYQTLARMSFSPAVIGGEVQNGVRPTTVANNELTWETTGQTDIGIDFGLFDNRLSITTDYYIKKTDDLLFEVPLPQYSGYGSQLKNIGSVDNRGFEFSFSSRNFIGEFKWTTDFNISFNKNEVLSLPDDQDIFYESFPTHIVGIGSTQVLRVGEPVGIFYGFIYDGVYQEGDTFLPGAGFEKFPGGEKFRDINGRDAEGNLTGEPDGKLDNDDRTIIGNPHPDFIWGLTNSFSWKGFDLNIFLQGSQGNDIYSYMLLELGRMNGINGLRSRLLNRWSPTNTDTDVPIASAGRAQRSSSNWVYDGSYVRLKNLSLGYTLPKSLLKGAKIESLRFYVSAQNLLTFTNYPGVDVEVGYKRTGAETRNTNVGLDYRSYPNAKTVTFGLNLGF